MSSKQSMNNQKKLQQQQQPKSKQQQQSKQMKSENGKPQQQQQRQQQQKQQQQKQQQQKQQQQPQQTTKRVKLGDVDASKTSATKSKVSEPTVAAPVTVGEAEEHVDQQEDNNAGVGMDEIIELQMVIEETEKRLAKEMMRLETEQFKLMVPLFKQRDLLTDKMPSFWKTVFNNHPVLSSLFTGRDSQLIGHLTSFKVEMTDVPCVSVRFVFNFSANSMIKNKSIWKEYRIGDDGEVLANASKLQYKNGNDITRRNSEEDEPSFFSWFDAEETEMEIYKIFKDEVWLNPLDYLEPPEPMEDEAEENTATSS